MNARKYLILAIVLFLGTKTTAQNVSRILDSVLTKTLDSMVTVLNVKSLSAAIQVSETTFWAGAKGISSLNPRVNVTPNDAYLIGSVTKTLCAASILKLADEGVLKLDDRIGQWLDSIPNVNSNITIRQLLRHQSGLYEFLNHPNLQLRFLDRPDSVWTQETLLRVFLRPPVDVPGSTWSYCNTNYLLLGMIIKKATGKTYYEFYRQRFFTPLGLKSFAIPAFEPITTPIAHVWLDITGDGITDDAHDFYMNYRALNSAAGAGGGYFATAAETSKWMRKTMRGDLFSANMLSQARETVPAPGLPGGTYGLGLMKKTFNNIQGYGHGGDLAYSANSWYFPSNDIAITVLNNDSKNNSWTLVPVIEALLKTYTDWRTTGLNDALDKSKIDIQIYPNPFMDKMKIKAMGLPKNLPISVELHNSLGQKVVHLSRQQVLEKETIEIDNVAHLPEGLYILTVLADGKIVHTDKIVK
jgi:D-alanyl-D-alanine carboxypeptidase